MSRIILIIFFVLGAAVVHADPLSPADVKALLDRIRALRASTPQMQADFQEQRRVHLLDQPITSSGRVWFQTPNKFRRETKGSAPSVTVSDGQTLWIYYPNFKSAERYSLARRSPLDAGLTALTAGLSLQNIEGNYRVTGTKNGDQYLLELDPRSPSIRRFLQKLDVTLNADLQVTRTEMAQPNGDRIVAEYTNHDSRPIPASEFEFKPPAGTEVTTPLGK